MNNLYNDFYIDGYNHRMATLYWDSSNVVRYAVGSFMSKQLFDNCLSLMQKGCSVRCNGENLITSKKGYISKMARSQDENNADGVHALIYSTQERVLKVYNNETIVDKLFSWLTDNTQSGLIEDWKGYLYNSLYNQGLIKECEGFDFTGKAPKIYMIDKKVDTSLIRNIKSIGLKDKSITLPVEKNIEINPNISFVEIIENLILPNIKEVDCHYNIGDEISEVFTQPIISGDKTTKLFPRQQVIAQGLLNAIKSDLPYTVLAGGCGLGKTYVSIKLAQAVMKEKFNRINGTWVVYCPGHLSKKWARQINECLNPMGIYPKITIYKHFSDINKLEKNPDHLQVIILPKDIAKRSYLKGFNALKRKFNSDSRANVYSYISDVSKNEEFMLFKECRLPLKQMKLAALKLEKMHQKKVTLFNPQLDNNGEITEYKVVTTSNVLKSNFSTSKSAYDFTCKDVSDVTAIAAYNKDKIMKEVVIKKESSYYQNHLVCPHCGGAIFDEKEAQLSSEQSKNSISNVPKRHDRNNKNNKCNAYLKADGTTISNLELLKIRSGSLDYKIVNENVLIPYVDEDGNTLTTEDIIKAKQGKIEYTLLIKKCNSPLWGADDVKGYRCVSAGKWIERKWGRDSIDISVYDEAHQYEGASNQGKTFSDLCKISRINVPLTGSLTSGVASDVFYLLFRLSPQSIINMGYGYYDESLWVDHFGRKERKTTTYLDKYTASGVKTNLSTTTPWREVPGISPMLFKTALSNNAIFRTIDDLNIPMPKLRYFKHAVEMSPELSSAYDKLKNDMLTFIKENKDVKFGGYIHNLYSYVDNPANQPDIYAEDGKYFVTTPRHICLDNILLPKERKLVETIRKELEEGRRTLLYATYTGTKGVSKRLMEFLSKEFKIAYLITQGQGAIKLKDREEWIEKQYKKGVEVILCNPKAVETGLDIIKYPSIYFYECPFDVKTLRQAERRAWRPSNSSECRIYYSYYKGTLQEDALKLLSDRKRASLALEGIFSSDILSILSEGSESIEKMLNKVLEGKYKLKENVLDDMFEEEETNFTFENTEDGQVEVTKTFIGKQKVIMQAEEVQQMNLFSVDEEFRKSFSRKKKSTPEIGQIGFLI